MGMANDPISSLRIAAPCPASWDGMDGDSRVRHCTLCSLNVYNFAEMTRDEVRELLARSEGRVCARLYRRADGTVITRDCPTGLRALRRRASRIAAALMTALLSVPAFALGRTSAKKPRLETHGSKVKVSVERVVVPQPAVFNGVILLQGDPLPGVTIVVRDEATKRETTAVTDVKGAFNVASLSDGIYRVDVTLAGLKPARIEHLQLKASEITHASVALQIETVGTIVVGAIGVDVMTNSDTSVTFTSEDISRIPH